MNDKWLPAIIVAALLVGAVYALHSDLSRSPYSNPPSPSLGETGSPKQSHPEGSQTYSGNNHNPALPSGTFPPKNIQTTTNHRKNESQNKSSTDWWLAILTGGLVIVGVLQLIVFGQQARRLRQSIDLTREISKRQERDMRASIGQAARAATAAQTNATAAMKSADAAITVESANLYVPRYQLDLTEFDKKTPPGTVPGLCVLTATVRFQNGGRTPAFFTGYAIEIYLGRSLPDKPTFRYGIIRYFGDTLIEPGHYIERNNVNNEHITMEKDIMPNLVWIYGRIEFRDIFGRNHEVGFCTRWNSWTGFGENSRFINERDRNYVYHRIEADDSGGEKA